MEGWDIPRCVVSKLLRELDPEGTEFRKSRRLKRREYSNPGPNFAWHIDGYDKLKPYGFPIHGAIDGFSRKILWLNVTRSNNSPDNIAWMFVDCVIENKGCPVELITDLGTENCIAAAIQAFFRANPESHRYVPSPRNQRIESWWSHFSKTRSIWWKNFFADMEANGDLDLSDELSKECLWYSFSALLQKELDDITAHWNTHRIRKSRHDTVSGRPDSIYYLPEQFGGTEMKLAVSNNQISNVLGDVKMNEEENNYTDYFKYLSSQLCIETSISWQTSLELYRKIMRIAQTGYA